MFSRQSTEERQPSTAGRLAEFLATSEKAGSLKKLQAVEDTVSRKEN